MDNGWIKLHRKLTEWEWYSDNSTRSVFIHLVLMANHQPNKWKGIQIDRGERLTSLSSLSRELGLSKQNVRTALNHLKSTGEITNKSTNLYRLIKVINYDSYQLTNTQANTRLTDNQHSANTVLTPNKNEKKEKNDKELKETVEVAIAPVSKLEKTLLDFEDFRKKIKHPLTARAKELLLGELEKLAPKNEAEQVLILDQSILHGWRGIFTLKDHKPAKIEKGKIIYT